MRKYCNENLDLVQIGIKSRLTTESQHRCKNIFNNNVTKPSYSKKNRISDSSLIILLISIFQKPSFVNTKNYSNNVNVH